MAAGGTVGGTDIVGWRGPLGFLGPAVEFIEESPQEGPGTAVMVVFSDGEVEVFEDPELCPLEDGRGSRKERID